MTDGISGDSAPVWDCLDGGRAALEARCDEHGVPLAGRRLILDAFGGDPAKRVNATRFSPAYRIASRKFGVVLQAASSIEAAYVYHCEHSDHILLCACQPFTVRVPKRDSLGRRRRDKYTPDYLVHESSGFVAVECKPREVLEADGQKPSPRYRRDGADWVWPAAQTEFARYGIQHRIVTPDDLNYVWLRNMRYLSGLVGGPPPAGVERAHEAVREARSARLSDLVGRDEVTSPALHWLIANQRIYCDLRTERLFNSDEAWVHETEEAAIAHGYLDDPVPGADVPGWPLHHAVFPVVLEPGVEVVFRDLHCEVVDRSADAVTLRSTLEVDGKHRVIPVAVDDVHKLLRTGDLRAARSLGEEAMACERHRLYVSASPEQIAQARTWWEDLKAYAEHGRVPPGSTRRTLRRHRRWAERAQRRFGSALLGLLRARGRAVGCSTIPDVQRTLLAQAVDDYRGKGDVSFPPPSRRVSSAYARFVDACRKVEIPLDDVISLKTFRRYVRMGSAAAAEARRRGARAGYQLDGPRLFLGPSLPRHGDRIWATAHVDHMLLDLMLVCARTGVVLGRPWLTVLIDAFSRTVLAIALSFDAPSREAVFAVLYCCASRHRRLPDLVVVDQGPDFMSDDLDLALAYLGVDKMERPASAPRYGTLIERVFRSLNTAVVHEQPGSTEPVHLGRMLSSSHRPERRAAWTLGAFYPVVERWFYDTYPTLIHSTLGATPREVWEHSASRCGEHVARYIACDDALRAVLSQTVDGDTRTVNVGGTVHVNHLNFAHPALEDGRVLGTKVPVKLCLADASYVYVYVRHREEWVAAVVVDGDADLAGLSWRAVNAAIEELRAQRRLGRSSDARKKNAELAGAALADATEFGSDALARRVERDAEQSGVDVRPGAPDAFEPFPTDSSRSDPASDAKSDDESIDFSNLKGF